MKKCTKCKELKDNFEFRKYKHYTSGICISCENQYRKDWRRRKYGSDKVLYEREILIKEDKNRCVRCDTIQPISQFSKSTRINTGYNNTCKSCVSIMQRKTVLKREYDITLDEYQMLIIKQNNKCAICHISLINEKQCVDHNHDTGEIRGILCDSCNRGLGLLKDNPIIMLRAVRYLKAHVKQGELLEHPEEDNQQPSLSSNTLEGSTTNSRILNKDSNANKSALQQLDGKLCRIKITRPKLKIIV